MLGVDVFHGCRGGGGAGPDWDFFDSATPENFFIKISG